VSKRNYDLVYASFRKRMAVCGSAVKEFSARGNALLDRVAPTTATASQRRWQAKSRSGLHLDCLVRRQVVLSKRWQVLAQSEGDVVLIQDGAR